MVSDMLTDWTELSDLSGYKGTDRQRAVSVPPRTHVRL